MRAAFIVGKIFFFPYLFIDWRMVRYRIESGILGRIACLSPGWGFAFDGAYGAVGIVPLQGGIM